MNAMRDEEFLHRARGADAIAERRIVVDEIAAGHQSVPEDVLCKDDRLVDGEVDMGEAERYLE